MSIGLPHDAQSEEDLLCEVCQTPLLNRKTRCPKCGTKPSPVYQPTAQHAHHHAGPGETESQTRQVLYGAPLARSGDDILTTSLLFFAGLGLLYGLVSPFIFSFDGVNLWHASVTFGLSLMLLAFRRLILK